MCPVQQPTELRAVHAWVVPVSLYNPVSPGGNSEPNLSHISLTFPAEMKIKTPRSCAWSLPCSLAGPRLTVHTQSLGRPHLTSHDRHLLNTRPIICTHRDDRQSDRFHAWLRPPYNLFCVIRQMKKYIQREWISTCNWLLLWRRAARPGMLPSTARSLCRYRRAKAERGWMWYYSLEASTL